MLVLQKLVHSPRWWLKEYSKLRTLRKRYQKSTDRSIHGLHGTDPIYSTGELAWYERIDNRYLRHW